MITSTVTDNRGSKGFGISPERGRRSDTRMSRHTAAGFTMIELLFVVLIIALLTVLVLPTFRSIKELARQTRASEEIRGLEKTINAYFIDKSVYPNSLADLQLPGGTPLDPWGHPYVYANVTNGGSRVDEANNPMNSDFDLYSMGPDGASTMDLTDPSSTDDVIRGGNGSFVGIASKY